jgi:hypothetical protein
VAAAWRPRLKAQFQLHEQHLGFESTSSSAGPSVSTLEFAPEGDDDRVLSGAIHDDEGLPGRHGLPPHAAAVDSTSAMVAQQIARVIRAKRTDEGGECPATRRGDRPGWSAPPGYRSADLSRRLPRMECDRR